MKLDVYKMNGKKTGEQAELPKKIFEAPINTDLMHQAYVRQMANGRAGTHSTKVRSEVRGGGRKPWRQKGTGRARAGTKRSPLWRHGGVVFPPKPRSYGYSPPKKVRRAALISALNRKIVEGKIKVVDSFGLADNKCREVVKLFDRLGVAGKVLCVTAALDSGLRQASWNVPGTKSMPAMGLNVYDLEDADVLLCSRDGIEAVQARFRPSPAAKGESPAGEAAEDTEAEAAS